jgi:hypothetical protein
MHHMSDEGSSPPVDHDWAWWRFALQRFMSGPNSIFVIGGILLVGAIGGGVVRLADGTIGSGVLFLVLGVVGLVAMLVHLERTSTAAYVEHRNGIALRERAIDLD